MEQIWGKGEFSFGLDYLLDIYVEMSSAQFFFSQRSRVKTQLLEI